MYRELNRTAWEIDFQDSLINLTLLHQTIELEAEWYCQFLRNVLVVTTNHVKRTCGFKAAREHRLSSF